MGVLALVPQEHVYDESIALSKYANPISIRYTVLANGCWECVSHPKDKDGYCKVQRNRKTLKVHRYVYEKEKGTIPDGYVVMHTCDNPTCINPDHLVTGTHNDNQQDKVRKNRQATGAKNGAAILTAAQVEAIRCSDLSCRQLSKIYGVHFSTISLIKQNKTWQHQTNSGVQTNG